MKATLNRCVFRRDLKFPRDIRFIIIVFNEVAAKPRSNSRDACIQFCKWFHSPCFTCYLHCSKELLIICIHMYVMHTYAMKTECIWDGLARTASYKIDRSETRFVQGPRVQTPVPPFVAIYYGPRCQKQLTNQVISICQCQSRVCVCV